MNEYTPNDHRYIPRYDRERMAQLLRRNQQLTGEAHGRDLGMIAHAAVMDEELDAAQARIAELTGILREFVTGGAFINDEMGNCLTCESGDHLSGTPHDASCTWVRGLRALDIDPDECGGGDSIPLPDKPA